MTITLIHHEGYTQEKDFYVLLKNPVGKAELGEPNLARITIIDDDGNDLDLCEKYSVTGLQISLMHTCLVTLFGLSRQKCRIMKRMVIELCAS